MATAGPNMCGTGSNYNDGGDAPWGNPHNIEADDTNYAITGAMTAGKYSQILRAKNFGFAVPSGSVITNVSFTYQRKATTASRIMENNVAMLDASGSPGTNVADTVTTIADSDENITKSGDGAYWGISLSSSLVNDADFGFQIKVKRNAVGTTENARVDYVSCTVTYVMGGTGLIGPGLCASQTLGGKVLIS
jgi:hypothetical protein